MEYLIDPSRLSKPLVLCHREDNVSITVPEDTLQYCGQQDILVLDFLYRSYRKKLNGVILNLEEDFNAQLQVSTFLKALHKASTDQSTTIIVLCPPETVIKWHYYFSQSESFKVNIITEDNKSINEDEDMVLLLSFAKLKLLESFIEFNFSSIIVDKCEEVATKMILRKLQGDFNIGITNRNFYTQPDQKLQWTMLNWSNPGCVGKLANFYEIDNDNFAQFRDSYREWWFRLTSDFCKSLVRPTLEEKGNLWATLREWAKNHNLTNYFLNENVKKTRKRKNITAAEEFPKRTKRVYNKSSKNNSSAPKVLKKEVILNLPVDVECDSASSCDTVIYEHENPAPEDVSDKESLSSGEQLILSLIDNGKSTSPAKKRTNCVEEDESDVFLKNVAAAKSAANHSYSTHSSQQFLDKIINGDKPKSPGIDLELAERRILGVKEEPSESDDFLKEICSQNNTKGPSLENNNYASTSSVMSDVDALVAEVRKMVGE